MNAPGCRGIKNISKIINDYDGGNVAAGEGLVVAIGFGITHVLNALDSRYQLSDKLIAAIREGMKAQQENQQWNFENIEPFTLGLMNTHW